MTIYDMSYDVLFQASNGPIALLNEATFNSSEYIFCERHYIFYRVNHSISSLCYDLIMSCYVN